MTEQKRNHQENRRNGGTPPDPGQSRKNTNLFAEALTEELLSPTKNGVAINAPAIRNAQYPEGFAPGVEFSGEEGWLTTVPLEGPIRGWDEHLTAWGFDPQKYEVIEPVTFKTWQGYGKGADGELTTVPMWSYKARIRTRAGFRADQLDINELYKEIMNRGPLRNSDLARRKRRGQNGGDECGLTVNWADWQIAKGDGDGLFGTVARIDDMIGMVEDQYRNLLKSGVNVGWLDVNGLGDLVEGCEGHYAMQQFTTVLNYREQRKLLRRLILRALEQWSKSLPIPINVRAVGGNHGECVDDKTEILTLEKGWIPVSTVTGSEQIATLNPDTHAFEWQPLQSWNEYEYEGTLHHYKNSVGELMVTPNHDCYVTPWQHRLNGPESWKKIQSSDNTRRAAWLLAAQKWNGGVSEEIVIPDFTDSVGRVWPGRTITKEQLPTFARFIGWYVSEGNCGLADSRICISQSETINTSQHAEIVSLIEELGFNAHPRWDQVRFSDRPMSNWLCENFGRVSKEKHLPTWLKNWPTELLSEFLDAYCLGDGQVRPEYTKTISITTTSDELVDDLTEVLIKLGNRTNSSSARYERVVDGYVGSGRKLSFNPRPNCEQPKFKEVEYRGQVYCPTVENGLWFARRNGRTVVTGNSRKDGKAFTDFGDNMDVAVFEEVYDVLLKNPERYGHVRFWIPDRDLTLTYRSAGVNVGLAHGHQFSGGASPQKKASNWWKGQMAGHQPIGDANILVSGHYHHLVVSQEGPRTWMQCPAMDGGSEWWRNQTGMDSPPGTLTFVTHRCGWSNLAVLGGWPDEHAEWADTGRGGHGFAHAHEGETDGKDLSDDRIDDLIEEGVARRKAAREAEEAKAAQIKSPKNGTKKKK